MPTRAKTTRKCLICKKPFRPWTHVPKQRTCGRDACATDYRRKKGRGAPKSLSTSDLKRVEKALKQEPEQYLAYLLMADSGLRVGEVVCLDVEDLVNRRGKLRDMVELTAERTKTRTDRTVFLSGRTLPVVKKVIGSRREGPLFEGPRGRRSKRTLQRWFEGARINLSEYHTTHHLRHTAGFREAEKDIRLAQELLGHANINTTQRYVRLRPEQVRERLF